jgi:hypothetical protein
MRINVLKLTGSDSLIVKNRFFFLQVTDSLVEKEFLRNF